MKLIRIAATAAIVAGLMSATAFAAVEPSSGLNTETMKSSPAEAKKSIDKKDGKENKENKGTKEHRDKCGGHEEKDPVKRLEAKKEKIQTMLKDGEITEEKADAIIKKIDSRIKEFKEFDSLNPQQKKEKLLAGFKAELDRKVKEGKLEKDKAEQMVKEFSEKVEKWDGKGYPDFHSKGPERHKKIEEKK